MPDPDHSESVTAQLERILTQPPLATSPSLSRFLRFMVEETLAGRAASINELTLGLRVFSRSAEFNPRTDPIVRVQAHHLRARLAQYYAGPGATDPVVIKLPPRTYVPVFRAVERAAAGPVVPPPVEAPAASRERPVPGRIRRPVWAAAAGD